MSKPIHEYNSGDRVVRTQPIFQADEVGVKGTVMERNSVSITIKWDNELDSTVLFLADYVEAA